MTAAAEAGSENAPAVLKMLLEDTITPDADNNFKWPSSSQSQCWSLFLNGTTSHLLRPSICNRWSIDFDAVIMLFNSVIAERNGMALLNTIERVYERGIAVVKDSLIFGTAYCSCCSETVLKTKAFELMLKMCSDSRSFLVFINYRERIHRHLKSTTGWSHALRAAVKKWYQSRPPIEMARMMMECPKHNKWTHRDVLALSHLAPSNSAEIMLFRYVVTGLEKTVMFFKNDEPDEDDEAQKVLQFIEEVTIVTSAKKASQIVLLMDKLKLSWNFVPVSLYREVELWEQMISIMPLEVMIDNTRRMAKLKLFKGNSRAKQTFISRCADVNAVIASKMHPYKLFIERESYRDGVKDTKRKPKWEFDREILYAIDNAMLVAGRSNLKSTGKRYFIAIDASDSMKAHTVNDDRVQCRMAAAFLTVCIAKVEPKIILKAYGLQLLDIKIEPTTSINDIIKVTEDTPLGGADCSRPIIYAKKEKVKTDIFVVFTDRETFQGSTNPAEALRQYRETMKIPAKLIVVYLNPDKTTRSRRLANASDRGILEIYGFSSSMVQAMRNFAVYPC